MSFEEFALPVLKFALLVFELDAYQFDLVEGSREQLLQSIFEVLSELRAEGDRLVVINDALFYLIDKHRALCTAAPLIVTPRTDKVFVGDTMTIGGVLDAQPMSAATAKDAAFEVMMVMAHFLSDNVRCHHILHLLPGGL